MSDDQRSIYLESAHQEDEIYTPQVGESIVLHDPAGRTCTGIVAESYTEENEYLVAMPGGRFVTVTASGLIASA